MSATKHARWSSLLLAVNPLNVPYIVLSVCAGAFDQQGCPLIVFPVEGQAKLSSELSKAEVVYFINYFLCLHKYVELDVCVCVCVCVCGVECKMY